MGEVQQTMDNVGEEIIVPVSVHSFFADHGKTPIQETQVALEFKALKDKLDFDTNQLQ